MVMMVRAFDQVAHTVTQRVAELLCAQVCTVDDRGIVVASTQPSLIGIPYARVADRPGANYQRVPIRVEGQNGEVIVAEPGGEEAVSPRLARVIVELTINQTAVVDRLPNEHELKNKFIYDLLHGPNRDETEVLREGQILGMDLARPRAVILINAADYILSPDSSSPLPGHDAWLRRSFLRARLVISSVVSFFELPNETICAYIGDGEVAVLKASSSQDLAAWTEDQDNFVDSNASWADLTALKRASTALLARLRRDTGSAISIGIGRYHPRISGLARSYQDARAALRLGRCLQGQNQVHCLDGLGIAALVGVSDERTKIDLATHLLSPLDQEPELLETLDVFFFENCCPSSTANRLSIHRNTLSYRIDKIASLTGLDPRRFDDAVQIRLALLLRSLQTAPAALGVRPIAAPLPRQNLGQMPDESWLVNRSA
jgi:carbohydrate diacid regulator